MPKVPVEAFAGRLKQLRTAAGLTQKEAAKALGMPEAMWQKYESGERVPTLGKTAMIADLFNVSLDYLAGRTNDPKRK